MSVPFSFSFTTTDPVLAQLLTSTVISFQAGAPLSMHDMAAADIPEAASPDLSTGADFNTLVSQIVEGLTYRSLKDTQIETLRIWKEANDWVHVEELQKQLVEKQIVAPSEAAPSVRGVLSGFGIRMAQKVTGALGQNRAISVLVQVKWDERGSSSHVLTPAGRKAVDIVLGRLDHE